MPKLTDELVKEALHAQFQKGETLSHWAVGIRQPNMLYMLPFFALAILPGVLITQMLTKSYILGLTNKRLIVLEVQSITNATVKTQSDYALEEFDSGTGSFKAGKLFTHITISDAEKPFKAKFHRMFSKGNRDHAVAIGKAISKP